MLLHKSTDKDLVTAYINGNPIKGYYYYKNI